MQKLSERQQSIEKSHMRRSFPKLPDEVVELMGEVGHWQYMDSLADKGLIAKPSIVSQLHNLGRLGKVATSIRLAVAIAQALDKKLEDVFPEDQFIYPKDKVSAMKRAGLEIGGKNKDKQLNHKDRQPKPSRPASTALSDLRDLIAENNNDLPKVLALLPRSLRISEQRLEGIANGAAIIMQSGAFSPDARAAHYLINFQRGIKKQSLLSIEDTSAGLVAKNTGNVKESTTLDNS